MGRTKVKDLKDVKGVEEIKNGLIIYRLLDLDQNVVLAVFASNF